jgi:hypothetical protein
MGNKKTKKRILNRIFGTTYSINLASFIQAHSIFRLKNVENMPVSPTRRDTMTAQCHENIKYRIKNPMEMIRIVDFEVSVFMISKIKKVCR